MGMLFKVPGYILYFVAGLWGLVISFNIVADGLGFIVAIISLFIAPIIPVIERILDQIGEWCPSPPPRAPPDEQEWPKGCQIPFSCHRVPDIA